MNRSLPGGRVIYDLTDGVQEGASAETGQQNSNGFSILILIQVHQTLPLGLDTLRGQGGRKGRLSSGVPTSK